MILVVEVEEVEEMVEVEEVVEVVAVVVLHKLGGMVVRIIHNVSSTRLCFLQAKAIAIAIVY